MTTLRDAAQQALDDLRDLHKNHNITYAGTIAALEAALAQQAEPVQEPVAWWYKDEPWFDGKRWHDNYSVTKEERVAKRTDPHARPLYFNPTYNSSNHDPHQ